jgi:DNA primase
MAMSLNIDALKRLNLIDFLSQHYGLKFRRLGNEYVCRSPFTEDKSPSFFVRLVDGHWLFKCFSSGHGGSIIDFVQIKENLSSLREVLAHIGRQVSSIFSKSDEEVIAQSDGGQRPESAPGRSYDIFGLYQRFCQEDVRICREYLLGRAIAESLVDELIAEGVVVHNRHCGHSYCCFAVRNSQGELMCLDNHQIDGERKFVLGAKSIFTQEWEQLPKAASVFVCEGVIDYLSVKTLESSPPPGLSLLGNQVKLDPWLVGKARTILCALDDDRGGYSAVLDIQEQFADKEIKMYDLEGHKDPNELLMASRSGKGRKLSPKRKLQLYHEFLQARNKSQLARRWGVDRSYMYEIARECEKILLDTFSGRRPGRKPAGKPPTLEQAWQRIEELEEKYEKEATEREELYCRGEFLQLRLKWAEIEAAELRGEAVDDRTGPKKKKQIKKKKKRKRSRR